MDRLLLQAERSTYLGNTGSEKFDKFLKLLPAVTLVVTLVMFVALVVVYKNRQERPAYVVKTRDSQIEGRPVQVEGVQVVEFLGIPFAESTAGSNRFRKPVPRTLRRKFVAQRWGRPCPQKNNAMPASPVVKDGPVQAATAGRRDPVSNGQSFEGSAQTGAPTSVTTDQHVGDGGTTRANRPKVPSEDCLHLNIWVPRMQALNITSASDSGDPSERSPKKPVMVFFHGGGFQEGSNSDPRYDGRYLAAVAGVVVVVPNYRVGPLAFIRSDSASDEEPGNLALLDQRMALDWVRSYIDDFEGDTSAIAVAGVGAGASSLALHLLSPEGQHSLTDVKRFVLHSGSPVGPYADQRAAQKVHQNLVTVARRAGCSGGNMAIIIGCLRTVSPEVLVRLGQAPGGASFEPTFESQYIPDTPTGLMLQIPPSKIQVLMGNVANEGLQALAAFKKNLSPDVTPDKAVHQFLPRELAKYGVHNAAELIRVYLTDKAELLWDDVQKGVSHLLGDLLYVCPTSYLMQYLSMGLNNKVYSFRMSQRLSYGAAESMTRYEDVDLLFGHPLRQPGATDADKSLSREVIHAWSYFVKYGSLPLVNSNSSDSLVEWPAHGDGHEATTVDISSSGLNLVPDEHHAHCLQLQALATHDVV